MSQPAVTQNIHGLEQSLGVHLFERLGRRIDLTPAGRSLLPYVSRIDALLDEAVATAREAGGLASRTLRLGGDYCSDLHFARPDSDVQRTPS